VPVRRIMIVSLNRSTALATLDVGAFRNAGLRTPRRFKTAPVDRAKKPIIGISKRESLAL